MEPTEQPSTLRAILIGTAATSVVVMPMFLTGAMAVQLRADLDFNAFGLGVAVAAFRGASAATSPVFGRLTDTLGSKRTLRLAGAVAGTACLGIAATATAWWMLVAWMMVGGCANSLGQPAAHRLLVVAVRQGRQGLGLGAKQSAQPISSMIAGLSLPLIAIPFGWRWGFVLGVVMAVGVILAVPRRTANTTHRAQQKEPRKKLSDRPTILLVAIAFGLGNAAVTTVPAFYVDSAVRAGSSGPFAGSVLATASIAALVVRFGSGVACDRISRGHLSICAGLVTVGSVGLFLLAVSRPGPMTVGVILALAAGWGFNVMLWYPLIQVYRDAPGAITGAVAPGGLIGGTIGPIVFGAVVDRAGDAAAWNLAAAVALVGAVAMLLAARRLAGQAPGRAAPQPA